MTHITKELALWLKERGCEVEHTHVWIDGWDPRSGIEGKPIEGWYFGEKDYRYSLEVWDGKEVFHDDDYHNIEPVPNVCPAYTYYDILVTHRADFFGKTAVTMPDETHVILYLLQCGQIQEAEDYIKTHSLFANKDKK